MSNGRITEFFTPSPHRSGKQQRSNISPDGLDAVKQVDMSTQLEGSMSLAQLMESKLTSRYKNIYKNTKKNLQEESKQDFEVLSGEVNRL